MKQKDETSILKNRIKKCILFAGLITVISGSINLILPVLFKSITRTGFKLREDSYAFEYWKRLPIPVTIKVYIWNIENPRQFLMGKKAIMNEFGPYFYTFNHWKEIISWNYDKNTVKYFIHQSFDFDSVRTGSKLSENVTVINAPIYIVAVFIKNLVDKLPLSFIINPPVFTLINIFFLNHRESLLKKLTVGQLLNGYHLTILDTIETLTKPLALFGIQIPKEVNIALKDNKYGIISFVNSSTNKLGPFEMYTGLGNTEYGRIVALKNEKKLKFNDDYKCSRINSINGMNSQINLTLLGPFMERGTTIDLYNWKICKQFYITYEEDTLVNAIPTYRFIFPKSLLSSPDKNSANRCNCRSPKDLSKCDGIFDFGSCFFSLPIALSYPHFLHSSSSVMNSVFGMKPEVEKHESFIDIEPKIGLPLRGSAKIQANIILKPLKRLTGMNAISEAFMPYIWIEVTTEVNEEQSIWIMIIVYTIYAIDYGTATTTFLGVILLFMAFGYGFFKRKTIISVDSKNEAFKMFNKTELQAVKAPIEPLKQNYVEN